MPINYHCQLGLSIVRIDAATNSCRRVGFTESYGLWVRVSNLIAHSLIDWLIVGGCAAGQGPATRTGGYPAASTT